MRMPLPLGGSTWPRSARVSRAVATTAALLEYCRSLSRWAIARSLTRMHWLRGQLRMWSLSSVSLASWEGALVATTTAFSRWRVFWSISDCDRTGTLLATSVAVFASACGFESSRGTLLWDTSSSARTPSTSASRARTKSPIERSLRAGATALSEAPPSPSAKLRPS
uniref:Uncharacterized protein n=1 Tax=Ixodes ricinus TaxID=34613 RepID=A0A6B0UZH4_IXORI